MDDYQIVNPAVIAKQWERFVRGQPVDVAVIRPMVYQSWQRSRDYGVDPWWPVAPPVPAQLAERLKLSADLVETAWPFVEMVAKIVSGSGMRFDLFDGDGYILKTLGDAEVLQRSRQAGFVPGANIAEHKAGTNAMALALIHNKICQVSGPEHYNALIREMNCSAVPIHDASGKIIGVVNILNYDREKNRETHGLAISLGETIENRLALKKTIDDLTVSRDTMSKIMEYLPHGLAYINRDGVLERYNRKLLQLLNLTHMADSGDASAAITRYLYAMDCWQQEQDIERREVLLTVGRKTRSFLLSTRSIRNQQGKLLIIEDTDSLLRLHTSLRGNRAIYQFSDIIGESKEIKLAKALAQRVASSTSAVLIYGESGTGKEVFAQSIHNASPRRHKPFMAINCGAIPSELIESELFGYEPGAFTGALKGGKPGKFEVASGGTLFLDEVENMPLNVQIKLLRALSTHKITRLGGTEEIPIDVRLISATKKDLLKEADEGNFRDDLYYRINVVTIKLPALRERGRDIRLLAEYYLKEYAKQFCLARIQADEEFFQALSHYAWRGNVRELKNVIERTLLLADNADTLTLQHLPEKIVSAYRFKRTKNELVRELTEADAKDGNILKVAEEIAIRLALEQAKGNLARTAKRLGIARSTLYQKIRSNGKLQSVLKSYSKEKRMKIVQLP